MKDPLLMLLHCALLADLALWTRTIPMLTSGCSSDASSSRVTRPSSYSEPLECTPRQRLQLYNMLPEHFRGKACQYSSKPWYNQCPLSQITACPSLSELLPTSQPTNSAVFVGCGKGEGMIQYLQWATGSEDEISMDKWNAAINQTETTTPCNMFPSRQQSPARRPIKVHCLEPLSENVQLIQQAVIRLGWSDYIEVHQQSLYNSTSPKNTFYPKPGAPTGTCYSSNATKQGILQEEHCEQIPTTSLDRWMSARQEVNFLAVATNGNGGQVLLGAHQTLKQRIIPLVLFDFHWTGHFWNQRLEGRPLKQVVDYMNDLDYTCYFVSSSEKVWRITNCWLEHWSGVFFARVFCVSRHSGDTEANMERLFQKTLEQAPDSPAFAGATDANDTAADEQ